MASSDVKMLDVGEKPEPTQNEIDALRIEGMFSIV